MRKSLTALLCILSLAACAPVWQKPEFRLADVRLAGGNLLQQKLRLQLQVKNPNAVEIGLEGLVFELFVAERVFASGQSALPVTIPKEGEGLVELETNARLFELLNRLPELTAADGQLHYRLKGSAQIKGYGQVSFDRPGLLDPSSVLGRGAPRREGDRRL